MMKNAFLILLVAASLAFGGGWQSRSRSQKELPRNRTTTVLPREKAPEPVEIYKGLRERVLTSKPEELGVEGPGAGAKAYGVLMEMGLSNGLASIVSFTAGDTSLSRGGGGILGGGGFPAVNSASRALV